MRRLYGLPALVAALTILANGFIQQSLTSASAINSSHSLTSLNPKKVTETSKEPFFTPEDDKSLRIFPKNEPKELITKSNQISLMDIDETKVLPHIKHKQPQTSIIKLEYTTALKNADPRTQKLPKNYIKSEFITKFHEPQTQQEINYSPEPQISNLRSSLEGNYVNVHLTSSRIKFPEVLQPNSKIHDKFDNLTLLNSSQNKKAFNIVSLITNGSSEAYVNTSNYRNSERSSTNRFSKADHNSDSPQAPLASKFNQLKADQSSFTLKEFPQGSSPSFVTTDSKTPNRGETTANVALNKQPEDGESFTSFAINVNGYSEMSLPTMVNKDSSIEEVANLFSDGNKFANKIHEVRDTPNGIDLPTPSKNLNHKEDRNLKSQILSQSSVVSSLLKSDQKLSGSRLCKRVGNTCLDQEIETKYGKEIANISPSTFPVNLELVSGEIGEQSLPQKLKGSIRRELCKLSSLCPPRKESIQLEKSWNSESRVRKGIEKGKSVIPLKYATVESKKDLSFVVDERKVENFYNKAIQSRSLNVASSSKVQLTRAQAFNEKARVKEKLRSSEKDVDTLNDTSGIINGNPYRLNPEGQLNYPSRKRNDEVLESSDHITDYSLKDQLDILSTISYEENSIIPDQYFQLNRNKGRRSPGIVFSNSSNDHRKEKGKEASDLNFIVGQIKNYAVDKEESNLENGTIKESSSEKNLEGTGKSEKVDDFNSLGQNKSGIAKINEGLINNEELSVNKSLMNAGSINIGEGSKINETLRMNQTADFNITLTGEQGNGENSTKVSTPVDQWPVKHSAVVEGDLVLGGLMMVHEREDTITCGPVMPQGGVQALEAMLYTLDRLNGQEIVPGVKIGAHILDDCDKDTYGLEMAVDFIKGL